MYVFFCNKSHQTLLLPFTNIYIESEGALCLLYKSEHIAISFSEASELAYL